jgi:prepilin-type N-terminal cleavage/methylation domain-containing protein
MNLRRAFTLIELLVVIAIIAILATLLLPVLNKSKNRAQGIQCLGNLKRMALGWQLYTDDNHDRYPVNATYDGKEPVSFVKKTARFGLWMPRNIAQ